MDKSKWEYKKLEVDNLPIGDVFDIFMGRTPSRDDLSLWEDGSHEWVSIGDMGTTKYISDTKEKVSDKACTNMRLVPKDTVIMSFKLSIGKVAITEIPLYTNEAIMAFPPKSGYNISPNYLYYHLQAYKWQSANRAVMGKTLNKAVISSSRITIPDSETQQRIVAELDCLNEMIALKQEQLKEFDKLAQSIFYDMFGDKDFPMYQLKDILSKIGSGATPSGGNQSYKTEGISLIRSLNVHNNLFVYKDLAFIDEQQAKQLNNVTIEEGDVLLNITGASVARCCVVPNDVIPARVNQHVSILRPRKELLDSLYLCHFLISCDEQAKLLSLSRSKAATREALPKNLLEKYSVPLPSLALQQQFAEKIQAIEAQKELVKQSIAETQHLLDSRMDYYFD